MNQENKEITGFSSFTLIVTFVCLSLVGLALLPLLPVKLSPSHTMPRLTVSFSMPGNPAQIVETEVTSKIEGMLSRDASYIMVADMDMLVRDSKKYTPYLPAFVSRHPDLFRPFILSVQITRMKNRLSHIFVFTYKE